MQPPSQIEPTWQQPSEMPRQVYSAQPPQPVMNYNDQMSHFQGCSSEYTNYKKASVPMLLEINYDGQPPPVHSNTQSCPPQPANSVSSSMTHAEISPALSPLRNQPSSQMPPTCQQPSEMPQPQPVVNYADNNTNYKKASVPMRLEINYQPLPPVHSNTESQPANSVSSNMTAEISPTSPSHVRIHPSSQQYMQAPASQPQDSHAQILRRREGEKRQRKKTSSVPVFKKPVKFDYQDRTATRIKAVLPEMPKIKNKAPCEITCDNVENLEHCTIKRGIKDPLVFKEEVPYRVTESIVSENTAPKQIISTSEGKSAGEIIYKRRKFKETEDSLTHSVSSDVKKKIDKSCAAFNDRHSTHSSGKIPKSQQEKKADASTKNIRKGKTDIETHAIDSQNSEKYQSFLPSAPLLEESSQVKRKLRKSISSSIKHDNEPISLQLSTSSFMSEDSNTSNIKNPTTAKTPSDLAIATPRNLSSPLYISDSDFLTNCPLVSISPDISYNISVSDNTNGIPEDSAAESVISKVNKLKKSKDASVHMILSDIQKVTDLNIVKNNLNHSGKEIDKTDFSKIKNIAKVLPKSNLNDTHSTHSPAKKTRPQQEKQAGVSSKNLEKTKEDMETYNAAKDSHRSEKVENVPSCVLFSKESSQLKRKTKKSKCGSTEHMKLFQSPPTPVMSNHSISSNMKNPLRAEKNPSVDLIIKSSLQESNSQFKKHKKSICPSVNNNIDCSPELQQLDMLANKSEFSTYQNCELVAAKCDNEKHSYPDLLTVNNDERLNMNVNLITKLSNTSMFNDNIDAKSIISSSEEVKVGEKNSKRTKNKELEHPSINSNLKLFESPPSPFTFINSVTPKIKHPMRIKTSTSLYPVIGGSIQESDSQQQKHEKDYLQPEMIIQDISFINKTFPESSYGTNNPSVTKPTDISPDIFFSDNAVGIAEDCAIPTISADACTSSPTSDIFVPNAEMLLNTVSSIMCDPNVSAFANPSELCYSGMLSNKLEPTTSHSCESDVPVSDDEKYSSLDLFTANNDKILNINADLSTKSSNITMFSDDIVAKSVISINEDVSRGEINSKICKFKELKDAASVQVILHDFQKITDVSGVKENSIELNENHLKKEVDKTDFSTDKIFVKELSVSPESTSNNAFYGIHSSHSTKKRTKPHQEKHAAALIKKLTKRQTDESHNVVTKSQTLGKSRSDHSSKESSIVKRKSRKSKSSTRELDTHKKSFESLPSSFGSINSLASKIKNHMRTIKPSSLDLVIGNSVQESNCEQQKGKRNVQQETSIHTASCVNLPSSLHITDSSNLTDISQINVQTVSSNMSVSDRSEEHKVILSDCHKIKYINTVKENIGENCEKPPQKEKDIKGISLIKNFAIAKNLMVVLEPFPYKCHSSYGIQTSLSSGQDSKLQLRKQAGTSNSNSSEIKADIETHNVICDSQSSEKCEKGPSSANSSKKSPLIRRKNKKSKPICREHENQWKSFEPKPSPSVSVNSIALKRYNHTRSRRLFPMDPVTGNSVQESNSLQNGNASKSSIVNVSNNKVTKEAQHIPLEVTEKVLHDKPDVKDSCKLCQPRKKDVHVKKNKIKNFKTGNKIKLRALFSALPSQSSVLLKISSRSFKCPKCRKLFTNLKMGSSHLISCRAKFRKDTLIAYKKAIYVCTACCYNSTVKSNLINHRDTCVPNYRKDTSLNYDNTKKQFMCSKCKFLFSSHQMYKIHPCAQRLEELKTCTVNLEILKPSEFDRTITMPNSVEHETPDNMCLTESTVMKAQMCNETHKASVHRGKKDFVQNAEKCQTVDDMMKNVQNVSVPVSKLSAELDSENPLPEFSLDVTMPYENQKLLSEAAQIYLSKTGLDTYGKLYKISPGKLYKITPIDDDDDSNPDPQIQKVVDQLQNYKCNCKNKASYQKGEEKPCLPCLNTFINEFVLTDLLNPNNPPSTSDASTSQSNHSNLQQEINVQAASFVNSPSNNLKNNSSPVNILTDTSSNTSGSDSTSVIPKEQVMATISTTTEPDTTTEHTIKKGDFTFIFSQTECALSSAEVKMTFCTFSRDLRNEILHEYFQDVLIDLLAKLKKNVSLTNDFETVLNVMSQYNLIYVDIDNKSVHLYIHGVFDESIAYCAYILKKSNQYVCADCDGNFSSSYLIPHILQEHKENNIYISIIN